MLGALYRLIDADANYDRYVNETVRLSLYGDFLYPLATDSTLEQFYQEKPEGEFCDALHEARTKVWQTLRPYRLKLLQLAPAKFIDEMIDGRLVCGAGGGGFLQVVLKKGVTKADVHNRLKSVFQDSLVDVWNCELVW